MTDDYPPARLLSIANDLEGDTVTLDAEAARLVRAALRAAADEIEWARHNTERERDLGSEYALGAAELRATLAAREALLGRAELMLSACADELGDDGQYPRALAAEIAAALKGIGNGMG